MSDLLPTHTCFDDALDFFEQVLRVERVPSIAHDFRVVHGACTAAETGEPYAHAWVEQRNVETYFTDENNQAVPSNVVWQAGTLDGQRVYFAIELAAFYRMYRVTSRTVYTVAAAAWHNSRTGHYGPWSDEYRALCRNSGGRMVGVVSGPPPCIILAVCPDGLAMVVPA